MSIHVFRGRIHCRIVLPKEEKLFTPWYVLCGADLSGSPARNTQAFVNLPDKVKHWWDDGTYWEKCPHCKNHPDLPFLLLQTLEEE